MQPTVELIGATNPHIHITPFSFDPSTNLHIGPGPSKWSLAERVYTFIHHYLIPSVWRLQCRVGCLEHGLERRFLPSLLHKEQQRQASSTESLLNNLTIHTNVGNYCGKVHACIHLSLFSLQPLLFPCLRFLYQLIEKNSMFIGM